MPAKTVRERQEERREEKLQEIKRQIKDGSLVVRKMTKAERAEAEKRFERKPATSTKRR